MKKVIVAGSRSFNDYEVLKENLDRLFTTPVIVVSGCAKGADTLGEQWANSHGYEIEKHPADWKNLDVPICRVKYNQHGAYNAMAGHNRNMEMLESVKNNPDRGCVVAFWNKKSAGTKNMIEIAEAANIPVIIIGI